MDNKGMYNYDIVIIGGGISGCEAAYISAVKGARTILLSINTDSIGRMSFENYISNSNGIDAAGKNTWNDLIFNISARENIIDIKKSSIMKTDNIKDLMIIDRKRQMLALKEIIEKQDNIATRQCLIVDINYKSNCYHTITNDGISYKSDAVILATGTFLDSTIFWGKYNIAAGRPGEITSKKLLKNLIKIGFNFEKKRFYIGPKVDGRTIDHKKYNGSKEKQKLNIIPEGKETNEMYIDGLKYDKSEIEQLSELRKIEGLENIIITRPGYGINYNILSPFQIDKNLESKKFPGIFFCGRINGISKYEETASEGYIAGSSAFMKIKK